jgi:hypothetical protein
VFLAVIFAGLMFGKFLATTSTDLMTVSMISHLILINNAAYPDQTQFLHLEFLRANTLKNGELLVQSTRHVFGESNPFADFASRGQISELHLLAEQMGIKTLESPPAEEFHAVLDRFSERFGHKPSTVKPRRPAVHATSASLGAANVVADKDKNKGRPLVPFYPYAFLRVPPSRAEEASIKALTQTKQLHSRSTTYKDVSVPPRENFYRNNELRPVHSSLYALIHLKNIIRPPRHRDPIVPAHGHGSSTGSNIMVEQGSFSPRENLTPHHVPHPARFCPHTAIYFRRNVQPLGRIDPSAPARGHGGSTVLYMAVAFRNVSGVIPYGSVVTKSDDRKAHGTGRPHIVKEISVPPRVDSFPHNGQRPAHASLYALIHLKNIVRPARNLGPSVPACEHDDSTVSDIMVRDYARRYRVRAQCGDL